MTTIGIDIRMLARKNKTGIEEYASELLSHMLGLDSEIRFKLFYNGWKKSELDYGWLRLPNVELCEHRIPNRLLDGTSRLLDAPRIDRLLGGVDKFFSPHIFLSTTSARCEKIVTFHDLSFEKYPEFYSFQKNFWHFSMAPRRQAEKADKIIAVSESTKEDLVEIYGIDPAKIKVIYSGLDPASTRPVSPEEKTRIREKYRLPENYVLYLGTLEPRKNIVSLINAFEKAKSRAALKDSGFKLVIAGGKGWLYDDIFRAADRLCSQSDTIFTGSVEEIDKPALYAMARVFVYPSFYEGFGFPPLEAMAQGVPVITSDISSIPEAVSSHALLINPSHPDELLEALTNVLTDAKLSQKLSSLGKARIRAFDWEKCARETLDYIVS